MSHKRRSSYVPIGKTLSGIATELRLCDICARSEAVEQDHDHTSDLCRGKLCYSCNRLLVKFDRPVEEIDRFLSYLRFWAREHAKGEHQTYTDYMRAFAPRYGKKGHGRWQHKELAS